MDNNKHKIGILTFHIAHNFGAMLQSYALPTALQKLGYDCEVIDYRFHYIDRWNRIEHFSDLVARCGLIGGGIRYIKRIFTGYYFRNDMHIKFDRFERKIIPHSKKIFRNKTDLNNMQYDIILFGSDQIWNSALINGIAEEYIGGFECLPYTKKVAYAASCGSSDFQPESRELYDNYLKDFFSISVREKAFQETLSNRGFQAEWVLDPTLLLKSEDWKHLVSDVRKISYNKYLLIYAFEVDDSIYDLARQYAQKKGLEIVAIAYKENPAMYGMKVVMNCGPLEFVSLFVNAEHIIAASFHGTAFSIILHKNFHCLPHPKYHERTDSLLSMFSLTDHNINLKTELNDINTDWDKVDSLLNIYREKSVHFLINAIESSEKGDT